MNGREVPPPSAIRERMAACRRELTALRRVLRISLSLEEADAARRQRAAGTDPAPAEGGDRGQ
jgi:hypothetical protein